MCCFFSLHGLKVGSNLWNLVSIVSFCSKVLCLRRIQTPHVPNWYHSPLISLIYSSMLYKIRKEVSLVPTNLCTQMSILLLFPSPIFICAYSNEKYDRRIQGVNYTIMYRCKKNSTEIFGTCKVDHSRVIPTSIKTRQ